MKNIQYIIALILIITNSAIAQTNSTTLINYDANTQLAYTSPSLMAIQAASFPGGPSAYVAAIITSSGESKNFPNISNIYSPRSPTLSDFDTTNGTMNYEGAFAWVSYLNDTQFLGRTWDMPWRYDAVYRHFGPVSMWEGDELILVPDFISTNYYNSYMGLVGQHHIPCLVIPNTDCANNYGWQHGFYVNTPASFPRFFDISSDTNDRIAIAVAQMSYNEAFALGIPLPLPNSLWLMCSGLLALLTLCIQHRQATPMNS